MASLNNWTMNKICIHDLSSDCKEIYLGVSKVFAFLIK